MKYTWIVFAILSAFVLNACGSENPSSLKQVEEVKKGISIRTYKGVDNKHKPCFLQVVEKRDEEAYTVKTNYSDTSLYVSYPIQVNEDMTEVTFDYSILSGGRHDEWQGEIIGISMDKSRSPIKFKYRDNSGIIRFFRPFERICSNLK